MKIQETRMKIQEASEDLQVGGILFSKYRGKLFEDEDLKTIENRRLGPEERQNAPRASKKRLWHENTLHAPREFPMRLGHASRNALCAPCICHAPHACKKLGRNFLFLLSLCVKPALLTQTQVETLTVNTSIPHSEFLVKNWSSSRGRQLWSFGSVFIFSLIF